MQLPCLPELSPRRWLNQSEGLVLKKVASHSFVFLLLLAAWCCLSEPGAAGYSAFPQSTDSKTPSGSISGQVTKDGKPAAGVTVLLATPNSAARADARTTTDEGGRFQLTHVPAGRYLIQALAPAFIGPKYQMSAQDGKAINLAEGETVEGIDIALTRGGVITGRVIDANGQPLVQENIQVTRLYEGGQKGQLYLPHSFMFPTDDRGVYRLFGVPPGRYIVGVGVNERAGYARAGLGKSYHALTYHPDVTDESKARIVEVTSGGEATGVDITLGQAAKAYQASGRIVDAETGKPVAGINYGYGSMNEDKTYFGSSTTPGSTSNLRGEFRLEGIVPGRYAAFAASTGENSFYTDPVLFEITDSDVTGLVIKLRRGSTVTGMVVIEGAKPPESLSRLSDLRLNIEVATQSIAAPRHGVNVGTDGNFRIAGLQPGKVSFHFYTYPIPKGLTLLRVERDGVEQTDGVEIGAGEEVSGVRVVVAFGTGVIRGQVKIEGGQREGSGIFITCRKVGNSTEPYIQPVTTDLRGRFDFEGLMTGEYELSMNAMIAPVAGGPPSRPRVAKQTVSIVNGTETEVTFIIDLNEGKQ
jgi:5-hydroxyisourate hydrolase-like protein (transthyretin family)